jgi:hypothetical protein
MEKKLSEKSDDMEKKLAVKPDDEEKIISNQPEENSEVQLKAEDGSPDGHDQIVTNFDDQRPPE